MLYGGDAAVSVIRDTALERGSRYFALDKSKINNVRCTLFGAKFDYKDRRDIEISLLGSYQPQNASLVIEAVDILRDGGLDISESALREGLSRARWRARFEILRTDPTVIFDGAHNPEGIDAAVESIARYYGDRKVVVFTGVLRDKDYSYIAGRLATVASSAYTITPDNPRALSAVEYADTLRSYGVDATPCESIPEALRLGIERAGSEGRALCCLGSLYTYVDVINSLKEIN